MYIYATDTTTTTTTTTTNAAGILLHTDGMSTFA